MATTITQQTTESDSVTLTKNSKGEYQWEIKVYGADESSLLTKLQALDTKLKEAYGTKSQ